ncbi:MAG: hypothetical protein H0W23_08910 [Chloroflexia bacterium]|nr:hypothetical protein [Chloroflexia bacterium]
MGEFELTANERHQVGFRLAAKLGHDRVFGIDWHDSDRQIGWDSAIAFAQEHGQQNLISFFAEQNPSTEVEAIGPERIRRSTVREQLLDSSDPDLLANGHRIYMDMAQIGEADNYVGADVILRWYERNMKIFVNLSRIISSPEDRVVVVIGAGHVPLLSHFIKASGRYTLESPVTYLS